MGRLVQRLRRVRERLRFGFAYYRAIGAADSRSWGNVIAFLEPHHTCGRASDQSRLYLAVAYLECGAPDKALLELQAISRLFSDPHDEAARHLNETFALRRVGHPAKARDLLKERIDPSWPPELLTQARRVLESLGEPLH